MKQPESEDSHALMSSMHALDCIGSTAGTRAVGQEKPERFFQIMKKALELYSEDDLLARFMDSLKTYETMLDTSLRVSMTHVFCYVPVCEPLCRRMFDSGLLHLYLQASRRQKNDGHWTVGDARTVCTLVL